MSTQYALKVKNESNMSGALCVYQKDPAQRNWDNLYSTAWYSKAVEPNTTVTFKWTTDYQFVWSETGYLTPGVTFEASELLEADPTDKSKNAVSFGKGKSGAYRFARKSASVPDGAMMIFEEENIPNEKAAIGLAMGGKPAFVTPAQTNMSVTFLPHPEYWIAFGTFEEGLVLDVNTVSMNMKVSFPMNVYSKSLVFNDNHTWSEGKTLQEENRDICNFLKCQEQILK